ncbi:hypothetical protein FOL47_005845 [Perkinsus chesapeaki]|uniref:Uncharacterized protein n=1 Tax=Perkinsus chesapeaki TaxID=330153 RepID=A0A7J6LWA1_PERCH|nr:hypothetical protein FOL47_005845 [Perkinsus chesapeaki]
MIPVGEYCRRTYGPYVSKVVSSPSGTATVFLAGEIATVSILNSSYSVDSSSGLITFDALREVNSNTFPYISHEWTMYYDKSANFIKLVNDRMFMDFNRTECVRQTAELFQPELRKPLGKVREFPSLPGSSALAQDRSVKMNQLNTILVLSPLPHMMQC